MDLERRWKLELYGIRGYDFNDCERSKLSFGEFASWAVDIKVLGAKPDLVSYFILRHVASREICIVLHIVMRLR